MPHARTPVVVVGDCMTDVVARVSGPLRQGTDTAAEITTHGGGSGANTAAWMAADGRPVTYVGRVGDDALGRGVVAELERAGVRVVAAVDRLRPTGTCVVVVAADGERTMLPDGGANAGLVPADLPQESFVRGAHLHLSGYTLLHGGSRLAGLAALDLARLRGMTVSVDPSSSGPLLDIGGQRFVEWTAGADVCLANDSEVRALTGTGDPVAAGRALAAHYGWVVVKRGSAGAVWLRAGDEAVASPAVAVGVVDTTGAGDAFAAGFLGAWLDSEGAEAALAAGNRTAARAVSRVGARPT